MSKLNIRGRGALENPTGRFEQINIVAEDDEARQPPEGKQIPTTVLRDTTRSIISTNDSPDVCMEATLNPYRGCEHGCIYCYARPTHEYFGLSSGLDFETKILAKTNAPELLREKLQSPSWEPKVITLSGVTDPYQPLERQMKITRSCLEVLAAFRNPVMLITKNYLITRDIDLFKELAQYQAVAVNISITTLDGALARKMEPRASQPKLRLKAVEELSKANIPVNVMIGPVLPGLTEQEIPSILQSAAEAGARTANYTMLRLPYGVKDLFQTWLTEHYPDRANKVLNRVRDMRDGKLNDPEFGSRMRGKGFYADQIAQLFDIHKKKYGLDKPYPPLTNAFFNRNAYRPQLSLF